MQHELILAGGGSGTADYLLPAAKKALESADCVIASERFLSLLEVKKARPMGNISRLLQELPELLETERIGIVVSGDPLLYSLCRTIQNRYPELEMQVIPGVGSLQLLGAAFGLTMEQAEIRSIHGRLPMPCRNTLRHFSSVPGRRGHGKLPSRFWHMGWRIRRSLSAPI